MKTIEFIDKYKDHAIAVFKETKIFASFILAQAALESGWGKSAIGNNLFGITCKKDYAGLKKLITTTEILKEDYPIGKINHPHFVEILSKQPLSTGKIKYKLTRYFKDYATPADCFKDHTAILLLPRYKKAFEAKTVEGFAKAIEAGGYATGGNYANTIIAIINGRNLKQYDK